MSRTMFVVGVSLVLRLTVSSGAEIKVAIEHSAGGSAASAFQFKSIPAPSQNDAATKARFTLVDGRRDSNGGDLAQLHDGRLPAEDDQPAENFFFAAGTEGGRLLVDLGSVISIKQINTYSWHSGPRGPQVYALYASDGAAAGFDPQPKRGTDPLKCGWKPLAQIDTRSKERAAGGSYGVSISDAGGAVGKYRYLLFDISRTEVTDPFGNTFYSEIDVVDPETPPIAAAAPAPASGEVRREVVEAQGGTYQITIDTTETPDLTDWAHKDLAPVVREWYPKLSRCCPAKATRLQNRSASPSAPA